MDVTTEIYNALEELGYFPQWNKNHSGVEFNYMLERVCCHHDSTLNYISVIMPNMYMTYADCNKAIESVNSHNHIGRLVRLHKYCISAVSSFYIASQTDIKSQLAVAINDIRLMYESFFNECHYKDNKDNNTTND